MAGQWMRGSSPRMIMVWWQGRAIIASERSLRPLPRRQQEFAIAFRPGDRTFDDALDLPVGLRVHPGPDARADLLVQRRVAHHAALADALFANLEPRLDEYRHHRPPRGPRQRRRHHHLEADAAGVADHNFAPLRAHALGQAAPPVWP